MTQKGESFPILSPNFQNIHNLQNIHLRIGTVKAPGFQGCWQWQWAYSGWLTGDVGGSLEASSHSCTGSEGLGSWHHWRGTGQKKTVVAALEAPELFGEHRWDALWGLPEGHWWGLEVTIRAGDTGIITMCLLRVYSIFAGVVQGNTVKLLMKQNEK